MFDRVGVVGCGLIGVSWSALFRAYGRTVVAWDPSEEVRRGLADKVDRVIAQMIEFELVPDGPIGALEVAETLEAAAADVAFVQENAPEDVPLKRALYARIEPAARAETIIASSTSSLTWSDLTPDLRNPERLLTAHPFNPPHLMPLVELFGRDDGVLEQAAGFYRAMGRVPIRLKKEAPGHIANRLASALWREAVNIVAEGIAEVADVDAALVNGPGLRWSVVGAHMAYHLGGGSGGLEQYLRSLGPSQERRWASLGTPTLSPELCRKLVAGVEAEAAGRSVAELEAQRDRALVGSLRARREASL